MYEHGSLKRATTNFPYNNTPYEIISQYEGANMVPNGGAPDDSDCCAPGKHPFGKNPCNENKCGHYDFRDNDSDGDGISDTEECGNDKANCIDTDLRNP